MSEQKLSIELDDRPLPIINVPLRCPACNKVLWVAWSQSFLDYPVHFHDSRYEGRPYENRECPNYGTAYYVDRAFVVHRIAVEEE